MTQEVLRGQVDWWSTIKGRRTHTYLDAWAMTVLVRAVTGDPTAMPPHAFGEGRGKSSPSDPADVLLRFIQVDRVIRERTTERERELILFLHGQQASPEVSRVQYLLEPHKEPLVDGKPRPGLWTELLLPEDPPPARYYAVYHHMGKSPEVDLSLFPSPGLEEILGPWGVRKADFLRSRHLAIGKGLAVAIGISGEPL